MAKRKNLDDDGSDTIRQSRPNKKSKTGTLEQLVADAQKQLQRAVKLAKGFERQKLSRRRKNAAKDNDNANVARIDAEVEALKKLEPGLLASVQLCRLVEREKALRSSERIMSLCKTDKQLPNDRASANIAARLYNANPVKTATATEMSQIRAALGIKEQSSSKLETKKLDRKATLARGARDSPENKSKHGDDSFNSTSDAESFVSAHTHSQAKKPAVSDADGLDEDSSENERGYAELEEQMIGSDSDDQSSIDFDALRKSGRHKLDPDLSLSPSASPSEDGESDAHSSTAEEEEEQPKQTIAKSSGDSAFLPSLTMGGYVSGSESEASELEEAFAPPRKNRRGQRARQQIWEKKYGQKAKHLQNGAAGNSNSKGNAGRDAGWDARRGATRGAPRGKNEKWRPAWAKDKPARDPSTFTTGSNAVSVAPRNGRPGSKPADDKPLHPSWAAKIQTKAKSEAGGGAFSGTKMTFD